MTLIHASQLTLKNIWRNEMKTAINVEQLEKKARVAELASKLTWLRVPEASNYANISESKFWDLISEKVIPSSKDNGAVVIRRQDIDRYWEKRRRSLE